MVYDPTIPCTNSINFHINDVKYVIKKALQNASIEPLICRNNSIEDRDTLDTLQYSFKILEI
ncbi:hypothetical protein PIROE2DRAFT_10410 [Piromyces sp. E2]|nr:hypothetical protein PIROE2DRAFT_10410 [Piromyces sp. E2]|eukprot:OUM63104.1 hypothetical protein PIROE2DRAFT_10410 [Piromyces sp. E2]